MKHIIFLCGFFYFTLAHAGIEDMTSAVELAILPPSQGKPGKITLIIDKKGKSVEWNTLADFRSVIATLVDDPKFPLKDSERTMLKAPFLSEVSCLLGASSYFEKLKYEDTNPIQFSFKTKNTLPTSRKSSTEWNEIKVAPFWSASSHAKTYHKDIPFFHEFNKDSTTAEKLAMESMGFGRGAGTSITTPDGLFKHVEHELCEMARASLESFQKTDSGVPANLPANLTDKERENYVRPAGDIQRWEELERNKNKPKIERINVETEVRSGVPSSSTVVAATALLLTNEPLMKQATSCVVEPAAVSAVTAIQNIPAPPQSLLGMAKGAAVTAVSTLSGIPIPNLSGDAPALQTSLAGLSRHGDRFSIETDFGPNKNFKSSVTFHQAQEGDRNLGIITGSGEGATRVEAFGRATQEALRLREARIRDIDKERITRPGAQHISPQYDLPAPTSVPPLSDTRWSELVQRMNLSTRWTQYNFEPSPTQWQMATWHHRGWNPLLEAGRVFWGRYVDIPGIQTVRHGPTTFDVLWAAPQ